MVVWYARNKWVIGVIRIEGEGEEGGWGDGTTYI